MSIIIGVCGRTASGKTSIAKLLREKLTEEGMRIGFLQMDNFYRELTPEEHDRALHNEYDFDCLDSFDLESLVTQLKRARSNQPVEYSLYDHAQHKHTGVTTTQPATKVWIIEGLYLFACRAVADECDFKIFMDVDADVSLARRIRRDCLDRGRTVESVLDQYERYVIPAYRELVEPFRTRSDITIHRGVKNTPAIEAVLHYIRSK